jgi:hypothetical protein
MKKQLLLSFFALFLGTFLTLAQTTLVCGGTFTDPAGATTNYENNSNVTTTICPSNPGEFVTVSFTSFALENNFDRLKIYNGTSASAPLIADLTGNTIPPAYTSSDISGCLTFVFTSDPSINQAGWVANITCGSTQICLAPISVNATPTNNTSAVLNWIDPNQGTGPWEILLTANGTAISQTIIAQSNPFDLTGLTPGVIYTASVRSICGNTTSDWSSPITFTTGTTATCFEPTNIAISGVTTTTANINWAISSNNSQWQVIIAPCGTPNPTPNNTGVLVITNTYQAVGLNPNTCYSVFIRSMCSPTTSSSWSQAYTFTTLANTTNPLTCGGIFTDPEGSSASYSNNANSTVTICPTNTGDQVTVTFTSFSLEANYDGLYVYNGNSNTSPQIASANGAASIPGGLAGAYWGTTLPGPFTSTHSSGCLTFVFRSDTSVVQSGWIANITCGLAPTCPKPTNLVVTGVTTTSATLGWVNNSSATSWEVIALPCGTAPTSTSVGIVTTVNPYTFTNLTPNSCYQLYVRAICSPSDNSDWSIGATLNTPATCPKPTALVTSAVTSQSASVAWTNNSTATSWEVVALPCNTVPDSTTTGTITTTNPFILNGLTANTCYSIFVRAICSSSDSSDWSNGISVFTMPSPPTCGGLFVDNGGLNGNYTNNADNTYTICPTNPGEVVTVTFTQFDTETNWDGLYVFDGNSITSPQIPSTNGAAYVPGGLAGSFWGTNIPGPFTSSDPSGCLTFRFRSDGSIVKPGWSANITCGPDLDKIILVAFNDQNNNGIKDTGETYFTSGSFVYQQNNTGPITNAFSSTGRHTVYDSSPTNTYDFSYNVQTEYLPYYSSGTTSFNDVNIPIGSGTQILYFPIVLTQAYNDVTISIVPMTPPRPGMTYSNKIVYKNLGVAATDGTITFVKPTQVTITAISQTGTVANATGFTYNFTNLLPDETRVFYVTMSVPASPIVNLGDLLIADATISAPANDINLSNNSSRITQIVVNSFDPNDKMESHGEEILFSQFNQNEDLIYTIRFQNYGTANAIDVRIEDVLDSQIDPESIRMISSSHNYVMTRVNNNIVWNFNNIQLVPISVNEELSMGYVQFRVKLNPGFAVGSIIPNTANIYFDTNPAIVTNTFTTEFTAALNNQAFDGTNFTLYPNPASQFINISLNNTSEIIDNVIIYDVLGKIIKEVKSISSNSATIDTSSLSKGVYLLEITTENGLKQNKKLVIK